MPDVVRIAARWKNILPKVTGEFHDIIIGVAERLGPLEHPREAMRALMLPLGPCQGLEGQKHHTVHALAELT